MQGPAGSKALAVLRLVPTGENRIEFALVGQDLPPNENGERYSLWFRNEDGKAQLVGDLAKPVGENGQLASSGPGEDNIDEFPTWFQSYETAVITQDENGREGARPRDRQRRAARHVRLGRIAQRAMLRRVRRDVVALRLASRTR